MRIGRTLASSLLFLSALLSAQAQDTTVFYYPKPVARTRWQPPMKPVTRLADVKARHKGEPGWCEPVVHDENSRAFLVQEPAGTRRERRLYPDSPAWWAVLDGRIRFEVEKPDRSFDVFEATKGFGQPLLRSGALIPTGSATTPRVSDGAVPCRDSSSIGMLTCDASCDQAREDPSPPLQFQCVSL